MIQWGNRKMRKHSERGYKEIKRVNETLSQNVLPFPKLSMNYTLEFVEMRPLSLNLGT